MIDKETLAFREGYEGLSAQWRSLAETGFNGEGGQSDGETRKGLGLLVRSAASVEQAFGGLNAQLWDDPFEWTLPEAMNSLEMVLEYFEEVDLARENGFGRIRSDEDLKREIWTPSGMVPLEVLLSETLSRARQLARESSALLRRDSQE